MHDDIWNLQGEKACLTLHMGAQFLARAFLGARDFNIGSALFYTPKWIALIHTFFVSIALLPVNVEKGWLYKTQSDRSLLQILYKRELHARSWLFYPRDFDVY
jgi:hypothetical protein